MVMVFTLQCQAAISEAPALDLPFRFIDINPTVELQKEIGTWTTSRRKIFRIPF